MQIAIERSMKDIDCKYDDDDYDDDDDDEDGISYNFDDSEPAQRHNPGPIPNGTAYSKSEYGDDGRTLLRRIQQHHLRGGGQLQNVVMVTDGDRVTVHEPESRVSPLAMEEPNSSLWSRRCAMSSSSKDRRWKSCAQIHGDGDWNGSECVHVDSVLFTVHLKIYEMSFVI